MSKRRWTDGDLKLAVKQSRSYRQVIYKIKLVPAGGNYVQVQNRIKLLGLDTSHFLGMGWNVGLKFNPSPPRPLKQLLVIDGHEQSYKLKRRLYLEGYKKPKCELCGWSKRSLDGRIPV